MTAPCEYCGAPVADADWFFRHGVMPCCAACSREPLLRGLAWLVFALAIGGAGTAMYLWLK